MALSNKRGALLLTTGNKSELSVGYCTLYGDMSGGLGVIADVPKTMVYRVARWLNRSSGRADHPRVDADQGAVRRAPAEPDRPGLAAAVRRPRRHPRSGTSSGTSRPTRSSPPDSTPTPCTACCAWCAPAEFKRKQAAPGLKVTDRAFGTGWRMPIAAQTLVARPSKFAIWNLRLGIRRPESMVCEFDEFLIAQFRLEISRPLTATVGASTARAPDGGGRTSRARRCIAA